MLPLRNNITGVLFGDWTNLIQTNVNPGTFHKRVEYVLKKELFCRTLQAIIYVYVMTKCFPFLRTLPLSLRTGAHAWFYLVNAAVLIGSAGNTKRSTTCKKLLVPLLMTQAVALSYFGQYGKALFSLAHLLTPLCLYKSLQSSILLPEDPKKHKLINAIKQDDWKLTKQLLDSGVSMEKLETPFKLVAEPEYSFGETDAIHLAVIAKSKKVIEGLLDKDPSLIHKRDILGNIPLHYAAIYGSEEECQFWIERGAKTDALSNPERSPLLAAAMSHNLATLCYFIAKGEKTDLLDSLGDSALHLAIQKRFELVGYPKDESLACVQALLKTNPNLEIKDNDALTPLHFAIKYCQPAIFDLLVEKGAKIDVNSNEVTPAQIAIFWDSDECLQKLHALGVNIDGLNEKGESVLHLAAKKGVSDTIEKLLAKGFEINAQDKEGNTPLHAAIAHGAEDFVQKLLDKGANVHIANNQGDTPLHLAASRIFMDQDFTEWTFIPMLLGKSADPNVQNKLGLTPLHKAVFIGYGIGVSHLLKANASLTIRDKANKNALMLAVEQGQFSLLYQLLKNDPDNVLHTMAKQFPSEVLLTSMKKVTVYASPCGGKKWEPKGIEKTLLLEIPYLFHDVELAKKTFPLLSKEKFEECMTYLSNKYSKESVAWLSSEKVFYDEGLGINQAHFKKTAEKLIPPAPEGISFDISYHLLIEMIKRVQNTDTTKLGYVPIPLVDLKAAVTILLDKIKNRTFDVAITGKLDTEEGQAFYSKLENMIRHVALLLTDSENPLRQEANEERLKKGEAPLPECDDDHRAMVLKDFALSSHLCGTGGTGEVFSAYDFLVGNIESGNRTIEERVVEILERFRERVVAHLITTQKGIYGEELDRGSQVHVGLQIRRLLGVKRGIRGHEVAAKEDKWSKSHITEDSLINSFDKYYTIDAILDELDEAINSTKTKTRAIYSEDLFTWLKENFAPEEMQISSQKANELENAFKKRELPETTEAEKEECQKMILKLAEELGKPELATKPYKEALKEARFLASQAGDYIVEHFYKVNEITFVPEITREGIMKMLLHPKMDIFIKS